MISSFCGRLLQAGVVALSAISWAGSAGAQGAKVVSPNGRVAMEVSLDSEGALNYSVSYRGKIVIAPSPVGMTFARGAGGGAAPVRLAGGLRILSIDQRRGADTYAPVHGKSAQVDDRYSEMVVHARETGETGRDLDLILRAYKDGAAFRLLLLRSTGATRLRIASETTKFAFPVDYGCIGLNRGQYRNSHEGEFDPVQAHAIRPHHLFDAPLVCRGADFTFALTESDLEEYAGAYFSGREDGRLGVELNLAPHPDEEKVAVDLAGSAHAARTPWRVIMLADKAFQLIDSNIVDDLAAPSRIADTGWIKPGKSSWDWWYGPVRRTPDARMAVYRQLIDFSARFGLPYMMIDAGWAKLLDSSGANLSGTDITQMAPGIDIPALVRYAAQRNVGLWLWVNWEPLDKQMEPALALYQKWGVKGIKVDFMDRQDQWMVDYYRRVLATAATRHIMVDLHGAFVPRGIQRTYPNLMTQEGVMGAEYNKWSARVTASHNVTLAYSRGLLGPMDYTPGGFRNVNPAKFEIRNSMPLVMTSRAQQLAMFVVYLSPLGSLADAPTAYEMSDGTPAPGADFLKLVPTTWDETRALSGEVGQYVVVARRSGARWFIGALNNEDRRRITIPLDFLGGSGWTAERWLDGEIPSEVRIDRKELKQRSMSIDLASGGGAAIILHR